MILGTAAYMTPGAGARQAGGQARRHLGVRLRALRDAHRAAGVRRATTSRRRWRACSSASRTGRAAGDAVARAAHVHQTLPAEGSQTARAGASATSGWRWRARSRRLVRRRPRRRLWPQWRRVALVGVAAIVASGAIVGDAGVGRHAPGEPAPPRVSRLPIASSGTAALTINWQRPRPGDHARRLPRRLRRQQAARSSSSARSTPSQPVAVFTGDAARAVRFPRWPVDRIRGRPQRVEESGGDRWAGGHAGDARRPRPSGATWGPDDTIIVATNNAATGLQRVSAAGGPMTVLTRPDRAQGEADHLWPEMLPGGRAVLFTITALTGGLDAAQVAVLDLQTGTRTDPRARRQSRPLRAERPSRLRGGRHAAGGAVRSGPSGDARHAGAGRP